MEGTAVLIPCYNEELSIAKVVRDFRAALPEAAIYVFDNNSSDRTASLAREAGAQVIKSPRQGKGNVVRHMFDAVDAEVYVMVDGDDTYLAEAAPELIDLMRTSGADMVVGTRLEQFQTSSFRNFHRQGNRIISRLLATIFGVQVSDVLSGYRVFSRDFVRSIPVMSRGFEIETELTIHAMAKRYLIREKQVPYGRRPQGSVSKLRTCQDGFRILKTIFSIYKDYKPFTFFGVVAFLIAMVSFCIGLFPIVDYLTLGAVPHLPSAVLAASLAVLAAISLTIGLLLHTLRNFHHESMELFRRCMFQISRLREDVSHRAAWEGRGSPGTLDEAAEESGETSPPVEDFRVSRAA